MRATAYLLPLLLVATTLGQFAHAERLKLDDSLSPVDRFDVAVELPPGAMARATRALILGGDDDGIVLIGRIPNVEVRLDTADFVGQSARIFLTLPLQSSAGLSGPGDLELRFEATGSFLSGSVRPGQSVLVFDGQIEQPVISVVFSFAVMFENTASSETFELEPYYEIEVQP
ncbi:MAG: hypothetical protein ACWGPN_10700 [Gammaproteobacteria bacterium]